MLKTPNVRVSFPLPLSLSPLIMTETTKIDIRSRTLRHTHGVEVARSLEKARKQGVPEDWIEKHKHEDTVRGMMVDGIFDAFVKKGETVKLNEVADISSFFFLHVGHSTRLA